MELRQSFALLIVLLIETSLQIDSGTGTVVPITKTGESKLYKLCGEDFRRAVTAACSGTYWETAEVQKARQSPGPESQADQPEGSENLAHVKFHLSPDLQSNQRPDDNEPNARSALQKHYKKYRVTSVDAGRKQKDKTEIFNILVKKSRKSPPDFMYRCCHEGCTYEELSTKYCESWGSSFPVSFAT